MQFFPVGVRVRREVRSAFVFLVPLFLCSGSHWRHQTPLTTEATTPMGWLRVRTTNSRKSPEEINIVAKPAYFRFRSSIRGGAASARVRDRDVERGVPSVRGRGARRRVRRRVLRVRDHARPLPLRQLPAAVRRAKPRDFIPFHIGPVDVKTLTPTAVF